MDWYYAANDERKGPLDQTEFDQLVRQGVITPQTLVWHEGMPEWKPYETLSIPPVVSTGESMLTCAECERSVLESGLVQIGGRAVCADCKPIALQRLREGASSIEMAAEQTRKDHLSHESSVKSVGSLYLFGAIIVTIIGIVSLGARSGGTMLIAVFWLVLAPLQFWVGLGLRNLKPWSRIVGAVLAGLGMLAFPFGTLINGYILYLLLCKKGRMVFSEEYKKVIAATPHIKYRTSVLVWIILIIFILAMVLLFVGTAVRSSR